jgi:hypothetical protein
MFSQDVIQKLVDMLVVFATDLLMPVMVLFFFFGIGMRCLVYYTVTRERWFAREFNRRVEKYMNDIHHSEEISFFILTKKLMEKTFYESFIVRAIMKRRNPDFIMALSDRLFLIQQGSAILIRDTMKQIKFLKKSDGRPKFLEVSKSVFQTNPAFNRVFGLLPIDIANDLLGILPGLFIVGGIFGTFLGIMQALPELSAMDLNDIEGTKVIMDNFLLKISFSMSTSIIGIILSVSMMIINSMLSPERVFVDVVERFENTLELLWNRSAHNMLPHEIPKFDENKDPLEALAEVELNRELEKQDKKTQDRTVRPWNSPTIKQSLTGPQDSAEKAVTDSSPDSSGKKDDDQNAA